LPHERLAVRIALTLESVSAVREAFRHEPRHESQAVVETAAETTVETTPEPNSTRGETAPVNQSRKLKLTTIANTAHRLFSQVIASAEAAPLREIDLPEQSRPPVLQWSIPLLLAIVLVVAKTFNTDWM